MDWQAETERRVAKGVALFKQGYNCSQAVTLAFADWYDVPEGLMARMSASFGGGIGRMRETCGTASGMFMLAGLEIATEEANQEVKAKNYKAVQQLAGMFKEQTGSLICRELLKGYVINGNVNGNANISTDPTPEARTDEYYKKRPCVKMVELAIRTYMRFLEEHDTED
jgi:C_GCAxxG_C_C family probable redox protein